MKKYVKWTIGLTVGILVLIMTFMVVIDPLFQYHYPWFGMKPIVTWQEQYYVAGMAKNFEYTNAIIGTSMSENFRVSWFDEVLGGKTAKLTINGSHAKEYLQVLNLVTENKNVKNIVMNLDYMYLSFDEDTGRWEDFPDYLYDENVFNDTQYVFNKDLIFGNAFAQISSNISGKLTDWENLFTWEKEYSKENAIKGITYTDVSKAEQTTDIDTSIAEENIDKICKVIMQNPDIKFTFFITPFSIAYWYTEYQSGTISFWENIYVTLLDRLNSFGNVECYFFADDEGMAVITNLDHYCDQMHYSPEINRWIVDCMATGKNRVDADYDKTVHAFFDYIRNYDYKLMFE